MMERGSIAQVNSEARARGLSYGQYVAAVYYPVVIVEVLPDGGEIQRTAAAPEAVTVEPVAVRPDERKGQQKKPVSKKEGRKCVICGGLLSQYQRKYCSDECDRVAAKERYDSKARKAYVSTAKREDRPCAVCGKLMVQVLGGKKYCSEECKRLGTRAVQRAYRAAHEEPKERYCQNCGIRIEGAKRKYCGNCAGAVKYEKPEGYWKEYNVKRGEKAREAAIAAFENQEDEA